MRMAMRTVPMLLDFWITSRTAQRCRGMRILIGMPLTTMLPGAVLITSSSRRAMVERQRHDEGLHRRAGLEDVGQRTVAQLGAGEPGARPGS